VGREQPRGVVGPLHVAADPVDVLGDPAQHGDFSLVCLNGLVLLLGCPEKSSANPGPASIGGATEVERDSPTPTHEARTGEASRTTQVS